MEHTRTDPFRCACGRIWDVPEYVQQNWHILYTLICDYVRVYTVLLGSVTLRTKPPWRWKRPRRQGAPG